MTPTKIADDQLKSSTVVGVDCGQKDQNCGDASVSEQSANEESIKRTYE